MEKINEIQFPEITALQLEKTTFEGTSEKEYQDFDIKYLYFELNSETDFKFRLIFSITHLKLYNRITVSVSREERIGNVWLEGQSPTEVVVKWVLEDFDKIFSYLVSKVEKDFPHLTVNTGNVGSMFLKKRMQNIQKTKQLI